jgi:predicted 3-demethylubiquinone-9 3-methyltransferase (glyoxalase superfamily)
MQKITPFLWFDGRVEEAAAFYTGIFPDAKIVSANAFTATFVLAGQEFYALNGGPQYKFSEAVSFFVRCADQAEVDYYWAKLTDGGSESKCGWLKDKFGLSWQIIPDALGRYLSDPDRTRANRVMQAMLQMRKIDVAALERAHAG